MLISIDENDPRPLYAQIAAEIKEQIRAGSLRPGDELPSVRELAESLSINLHTVHHAYRELRNQGIILLRLGQRARVAPRRPPAARAEVQGKLAGRLKEMMTEAYHLGLSAEDFRALVDELLEEKSAPGTGLYRASACLQNEQLSCSSKSESQHYSNEGKP
ncbi:MAG: GntR family transcriptional regulator [Armatimonadota bacterium]